MCEFHWQKGSRNRQENQRLSCDNNGNLLKFSRCEGGWDNVLIFTSEVHEWLHRGKVWIRYVYKFIATLASIFYIFKTYITYYHYYHSYQYYISYFLAQYNMFKHNIAVFVASTIIVSVQQALCTWLLKIKQFYR